MWVRLPPGPPIVILSFVIKRCSKCLLEKDISEFSVCKTSADGYRSTCKICRNNKRRDTDRRKREEGFEPKYLKLNIVLPNDLDATEKAKLYQKEYRKIYRAEINEKRRLEVAAAKKEGIAFYGGKCSCCGESTFEFLTLEHIEGRLEDKENSKKRRTGKDAWFQVRKEGFPNKYTVLCFNCNCAKGAYGSCPHTWKKEYDNNN